MFILLASDLPYCCQAADIYLYVFVYMPVYIQNVLPGMSTLYTRVLTCLSVRPTWLQLLLQQIQYNTGFAWSVYYVQYLHDWPLDMLGEAGCSFQCSILIVYLAVLQYTHATWRRPQYLTGRPHLTPLSLATFSHALSWYLVDSWVCWS